MKREILVVVIMAVIIAVFLVILNWPLHFWPFTLLNTQAINTQANNQNQNAVANKNVHQEIVGIQVTLPLPGAEVSSPITISGSVNGGGWGGFEGQVGGVKLLDSQGKTLAQAPLTAVTDWTQTDISFKTTITLTTAYQGSATLVFHNENASGDPKKDKQFGLSVIIK